MKKFLLAFIILITLSIPCLAQNDQIINARNVNTQITNPGGTGSGNVAWSTLANQTYVMAPLGADYGFCVSLVNNNPTSPHTFNVAAFQSGDSNVIDYSHNTGRFASLAVVGTPSPIAANTTQTFFVRSNGAAKIAFQFTGATTQAGNPDTVDIYAVQTTAPGCGTVNPQTGQSYNLATPNAGTSAAPPIMTVSDALNAAYVANVNTVNPTAAFILLNIQDPTGQNKKLYFDKAVLSTTVAVEIRIYVSTGPGTGCLGQTGFNLTPIGVGATASVSGNGCTANPPVSAVLSDIYLAANTSFQIDLKGVIGTPNNAGVAIYIVSGVTGNVTGSLYWYEK